MEFRPFEIFNKFSNYYHKIHFSLFYLVIPEVSDKITLGGYEVELTFLSRLAPPDDRDRDLDLWQTSTKAGRECYSSILTSSLEKMNSQ